MAFYSDIYCFDGFICIYVWRAFECVFNLKVIVLNLHFRNSHSTQIQFIINESTTIMLNVQSVELSDAHT